MSGETFRHTMPTHHADRHTMPTHHADRHTMMTHHADRHMHKIQNRVDAIKF